MGDPAGIFNPPIRYVRSLGKRRAEGMRKNLSQSSGEGLNPKKKLLGNQDSATTVSGFGVGRFDFPPAESVVPESDITEAERARVE